MRLLRTVGPSCGKFIVGAACSSTSTAVPGLAVGRLSVAEPGLRLEPGGAYDGKAEEYLLHPDQPVISPPSSPTGLVLNAGPTSVLSPVSIPTGTSSLSRAAGPPLRLHGAGIRSKSETLTLVCEPSGSTPPSSPTGLVLRADPVFRHFHLASFWEQAQYWDRNLPVSHSA